MADSELLSSHARDVTDYKGLDAAEQERLLELQQTILEAVALGHSHRDVIEQICRLEEQLLPNAVASVMLLDERGLLNVFAAPSIPPAGIARLNGLRPGPAAGSCGNVIYRQEPIFVGDTLNDPRWEDLRQLAIDFDLKTCWSMPIRGAGGAIIGTFALSSFEHRLPSGFHRKMLEVGASIIGIVLERRRQHGALQASETRYRQLFEVNQAIKLVIEPVDGRIVDANPAAVAFYGYPRERLLQLTIADINTLPQEAVMAALREAEATHRLHNQFIHRIASGEMRNVEVHSGPVTVGDRTYLYSIIHDITERIQAQEALRRERDFVNAVFENVGSVIVVIDADGIIVRFNRAAEHYSGYSFAEVRGQPFFWKNFLAEEQAAGVQRMFEGIWRGASVTRYENCWVHRNGTTQLLDWTNTLLRNDGGEAEYLVTIGSDIAERKRAEQALQLAAGVFQNTQEAIVLVNNHGHILDVNAAFLRSSGYARDEVVGKTIRLLRSRWRMPHFYRAMWSAIKEYGHWGGEIVVRRKDGSEYPSLLNVSAIYDETGSISRFVAVYTDISVMKQQEAALERLAHYDALTGLPNRILLADRMRQALAHAQRSGRLMVVAYLDLDNFKPVNDLHGHDIGDHLLVEIAQRITSVLRATDTVARLGGDEFVILLPEVRDMEECNAILARVGDALSEAIRLPGGGVEISVAASIGIALYTGGDVDADALLRRADQAMYQAKHAGRGRIQIFHEA